ncbi:MAG: ribosome maturation factor RimM [Paludibacteraceae bacterium]|nr:ribosome maturation factor RimM [Paludibacteraceae bacterium]
MRNENIIQVGKILKNHGVKGEVTVAADNDALFDATCVIIPIEGLYVPFFVESVRPKSETSGIIKFECIDSTTDTLPLLGASVYMKKSEIADSDDIWESFEGYKLYNGSELVGEITGINDQTENALFIVKSADSEILIPIVEDWINSVDDVTKIIHTTLPDGLVDIN